MTQATFDYVSMSFNKWWGMFRFRTEFTAGQNYDSIYAAFREAISVLMDQGLTDEQACARLIVQMPLWGRQRRAEGKDCSIYVYCKFDTSWHVTAEDIERRSGLGPRAWELNDSEVAAKIDSLAERHGLPVETVSRPDESCREDYRILPSGWTVAQERWQQTLESGDAAAVQALKVLRAWYGQDPMRTELKLRQSIAGRYMTPAVKQELRKLAVALTGVKYPPEFDSLRS